MEAAKDLLKRAVDLDTAEKYSEALICYEEGIQNLLRAMGGNVLPWSFPSIQHNTPLGLKKEAETKEVRKKVEQYLSRAEELKQQVKLQEGTSRCY